MWISRPASRARFACFLYMSRRAPSSSVFVAFPIARSHDHDQKKKQKKQKKHLVHSHSLLTRSPTHICTVKLHEEASLSDVFPGTQAVKSHGYLMPFPPLFHASYLDPFED